MHAHMVVLQLPRPRDSDNNRVSFESLNGMCCRGLFEESALAQLDRAAIDLLMFLAS